jgi:general stress protein 26
MATIEPESDHSYLWFFTNEYSPKVEEIQSDQKVNLSYANPEKEVYVSVSGNAKLVTDKEILKQHWSPVLKAWFPDGLQDPKLALLRVDISQAEYWDSPSNKMIQFYGMVRAIMSRETYDPGDHKKINF